MRKIFFLMLGGLLCGMLYACEDSGAPKIGVMDMNRLLQESAPGKAGIQFIEQQQAGLQERMEAIQKKLEKDPKDEAAQRELQKLFMEAQQQVQGDGQAVVAALLEAIQKVAGQFRKQHGYVAIMRIEALDSFDPALDITPAMMKEVDKLQLDFKTILANQPKEQIEMEEEEPGDEEETQGEKKPKTEEKTSPAEPKASESRK